MSLLKLSNWHLTSFLTSLTICSSVIINKTYLAQLKETLDMLYPKKLIKLQLEVLIIIYIIEIYMVNT